MKKTLILVLLVMLAGSLSLMAQTKKKKPVTRKKTTKTVKPRIIKPDTAAINAKLRDSLANVATMVAAQEKMKMDSASKPLPMVKDSDDGYYKSIVMTNAKPFPIHDVNPNNIRFYHRYWRDILLKDPRNHKFSTPGSTLIEALLKGVKDKKVVPYDPTGGTAENTGGDAFVQPMSYDQLMGKMRDTATIDILDKDGNKIGSRRQLNDFSPDKVAGYRIKEDYYFDKQRSKFESRMIGIAPLITLRLTNGDTIGTQPVCWFKFNECRKIFATMDVSDPEKNLYDVSMDDMFVQRQFNSKIIEESNPLGQRIEDYIKDPADRDKESARIEKKLADYKKNIFLYKTSAEEAMPKYNAEAATEVKPKKGSTKKSKTPPQTPDTGTTPVKQ